MAEVRYCTTEDGVSIAYTVTGEGPPVIALPFFLESFSLDYLVPEIAEALRSATRGFRLVRFDTRGTGLSQRDVTDMSLPALRRDIDAVADELRLERCSLVGSAAGTVRGLDYGVTRPERVDRLVLFAAFAKIADVFSEDLLRGFVSLARSNWTLAARTFADLGIREQSDEFGLRLAELHERSTTGTTLAHFIEDNVELDLTPLVPRVKAPTLLIYGLSNPLFPVTLGQELAAAMPDARLLALPDVSFAFLFDKNASRKANAFLKGAVDDDEPVPDVTIGASPFRTVLFTDLVGHTDMMQRLGDDKGRDVLREHERITRETLAAHGGAEVKTMGDGFMASFGSVTKAMDCAIALQRAFAAHEGEPLHVRVGLNAGEPIEEDGDLFGSTVILASRIAAQAGAGEILGPETVRGLLSGKSYVYADRGEVALKGFEDAVRLYEVRWRGDES